MDAAPDLTLVLRDFGFVMSIANVRPVVERRPSIVVHTIPTASGSPAVPALNAAVRLKSADIVDVCATLIYSLDLPVPADLDGEVPLEMFTSEHRASHPIRRGRPNHSSECDVDTADSMAGDDQEKLLRQLQLLGYLE